MLAIPLVIENVGTTPHIFAFTHGRGAWRVPTAAELPTFLDVPPSHPFFEALAKAGITGGCSTSPPRREQQGVASRHRA